MSKFIVEYRSASNEILGYLHIPCRSARTRHFTTTNIRAAARLDRNRALIAATNYNQLYRDEGNSASVLPAPRDLDPFAHVMVRRP